MTVDSRQITGIVSASRSMKLPRPLRFWLWPWIGVAVYPLLLGNFTGAISSYRETGALSLAAGAVLLMMAAASVPVLATRALILMRDDDVGSPVLTRSLLYLMFSVSPLYVLTILLAASTGMAQYHGTVWTSAWIIIGLVLCFRKTRKASTVPGAELAWLRMTHGAAALCLLLGFLIVHLINHDLALWSVELHGAVMELLRLWYRSESVEPVLFALFAVMIGTGAPLVANHSRRSPDAFRVIQMATGVYIAVFLGAHVMAVLGARAAGVDTDWIFATGPNGLLDGRGMLIPYYIWAVFFLALHVGCGLRIVLLKHGMREVVARNTVYGVAAVGLIVATLFAIAAL